METIHLVGNAHLDPVWLWRWQEGYGEIKATFRSALDRMKEFPEFVFTSGCAAYYKWVEENDPDMFREIQERIREGRWVIVGGWWIQPDCNIPSGESFARHSLYSQRYFQEKFGTRAKVGYNVDSFGHNGMLPQLLKKSGMDYYVFMRPGDHEKELPGNLFWWESMDGSRVLTFKIPFSYGNWWREGDPVVDKLKAVMDLAEEQGVPFMDFYGVGNHGGGPTISNLRVLEKVREELGKDGIRFSSPDAYFQEALEGAEKLPVVRDDLQHHASGCYSVISEIKANNRKAEHRLMTAEKFATVAWSTLGLPYPGDRIERAWENVLFNQFHDIMGGCSIQEAYEDAREFHGEALRIGGEVLNSALQKISWSINTMGDEEFYISKEKDWALWEQDERGTPVVVFNPLAWEVEAPVVISKRVEGVTDDLGNPLDVQHVRAPQTNGQDKWDTLFTSKIPALGYRVFWAYKEKAFDLPIPAHTLEAGEDYMENDWLRVEIEPHTGHIRRLYDKEKQLDVLSGRGAVPVVVDEHDSDTWAHGIFSFRREIGKFADASVQLLEKGPVRATLRVTSRYNRSLLRQDFMLYRDRKNIEVKVKLDWREEHKMLKLSFPVNVKEAEATYEIPYGYITRPVNGEEEPGQQWVDVSGKAPDQSSYGLALANTSKYSYDVLENDLRLTVVRSPIYADHFGQQERDEWCEFTDQGIQYFSYSLLPHGGSWQASGIVREAYQLNVPPIPVLETYHKGPLPLQNSYCSISAPNVMASALKSAEEGEDLILRCYESHGEETRTRIHLGFLNLSWEADFGPCEIKTFRIAKDGGVREVNLLEE